MFALAGTSWPEAGPEIEDLPHAVECGDCQEAVKRGYTECECGHNGEAPVVLTNDDGNWMHCPSCGACACEPHQTEPNEPEPDPDLWLPCPA